MVRIYCLISIPFLKIPIWYVTEYLYSSEPEIGLPTLFMDSTGLSSIIICILAAIFHDYCQVDVEVLAMSLCAIIVPESL